MIRQNDIVVWRDSGPCGTNQMMRGTIGAFYDGLVEVNDNDFVYIILASSVVVLDARSQD